MGPMSLPITYRQEFGNPKATVASAPDCTPCSHMATLVREGPAAPESIRVFSCLGVAARPGRVADYRQSSSTCQTCRVLLDEFGAQCSFHHHAPPGDNDEVEIEYVTYLGIWRVQLVSPTPSGPYLPDRKAELNFVRYLDPRTAESAPPSLQEREAASIPIAESGIDFERIKSWKTRCDANHRGICFDLEDPWRRMERVEDILLVDVESECISPQHESTVYLALSYVWGVEGTPLVANRENFDALIQPGSLAPSSPLGQRMPRTIRDAMTVTRRMGYRYLWVDRLCIVQDDDTHKQRELAGMAAIYANASITIIAAHGDDSHGLAGVEPGSSPPRRPFSRISLPGGVHLVMDDRKELGEPYELPGIYDYRRRGWTLQEETLSSRTLSFGQRQVKWKCRKMRCEEAFDDRRQLRDNRANSTEIQLYKPYPDMRTYGHLARDYTGRLLTYDADAVDAFSAIIAAFSRSMEGDMLFGLPELLFEGSLLWQPREPLRRRLGPNGQDHVAPSWSFLGWSGGRGGLDLTAWTELYNVTLRGKPEWHYFQSVHKLFSCVDFFKVDAATAAREPVRSSYRRVGDKKNSDGYDGDDDPPGARQSLTRSSNRPPDIAGRLPRYRTERPHYSHRVRLTPAPIPAPRPSSGGGPRWLPVLEFHTQLCRIAVGGILRSWDKYNEKDESAHVVSDTRCVDISLVADGEGSSRIVGAIRLNSTRSAAETAAICSPGTRLELVALSRCVSFQRMLDRDMLPELRVFHATCSQPCHVPEYCKAPPEVVASYEYYNVMWIGWNGKVAYRKAIGRVLASYWDEQRPEEVDITLG